MRRREYLKVAGAVGGVGAAGLVLAASNRGERDRDPPDGVDSLTPTELTEELPGETETDTRRTATETEPLADDYGTVVDLVSAGADPTGKTAINDVLRSVIGDDTLVEIPPGTYRIEPLELKSLENVALVSLGSDPAVLRPPAGTCRGREHFLQFADVKHLLVEGLTFDFRRRQTGGVVSVIADDDATIRDTAVFGSCRAQIATFRIDIAAADGTGLVENLRIENTDENPTLTGIFVGEDHSGSLTFRDCSVSGFSDNGLYASAPGLDEGAGGEVRVVGGTYRNNNVAGVRLGSVGSIARGVLVVVDRVPPGEQINARGIRLRGGSDHLVSGCRVVVGNDAGPSFGAVVFSGDTGGAVVEDSSITVHRDGVQALHAFPPDSEPDSPPEFRNVRIDGTADNKPAVTIQSRDETLFRNCTITQTGQDRDGISLTDSADCRVENCRIAVTGTPIALQNATVTLRDTTILTPNGEELVERRTVEDRPIYPS